MAEAAASAGLARSFAPVADRRARTLILGSMPGQDSLRAARYYAHPRNAFWPIVADFCGLAPEAAYAERLRALKDRGLALWDVLERCERPGSLDASIDPASIVVNDFESFLRAHRAITCIVFNGRTAEKLFVRRAAPGLGAAAASIRRIVLPSTSPAYAAMPFAEKRRRWHAVLRETGAAA